MKSSTNENNWLTNPAASRRRTRDTAERFLAYSRAVLENIREDVKGGVPIDPQLVRDLELTIAKHEAPASRSYIRKN
jgi:hypothetical protein